MIFEEVGIVKFDVGIFVYVLECMGNLIKSWVLMVGDNLYFDILGGLNFGIEICWFNVY